MNCPKLTHLAHNVVAMLNHVNDVDSTLRQRGRRGQGYTTITKNNYDKQKSASIEYKKVFLFKSVEAGEADEIYMHSST